MCYEYITPELVAAAGGDLNKNPSEEVLKKAFAFCTKVPEELFRLQCMGGFGKEFVLLSNGREIRTFDSLSDAQIEKTHRLCHLAGDIQGEIACINHAVDSLYWGGENSHVPVIRFCSRAATEKVRSSCFDHLTGAVYYYKKNNRDRELFCSGLPKSYKQRCMTYEPPR